METLSVNPPSSWLVIFVAYMALVLTLIAFQPEDKTSPLAFCKYTIKFVWHTLLILSGPLLLLFFNIVALTTMLWIAGALAFALIFLIVAADMNIPSGSNMPTYLRMAVLPWVALCVAPFWIASVISKIKQRDKR